MIVFIINDFANYFGDCWIRVKVFLSLFESRGEQSSSVHCDVKRIFKKLKKIILVEFLFEK